MKSAWDFLRLPDCHTATLWKWQPEKSDLTTATELWRGKNKAARIEEAGRSGRPQTQSGRCSEGDPERERVFEKGPTWAGSGKSLGETAWAIMGELGERPVR